MRRRLPGGSWWGSFPEYDIEIGTSVESYESVDGYRTNQGVYKKTFTNGLVLVNPSQTATSETINLDQPLHKVVVSGGNSHEEGSQIEYIRVNAVVLKPNTGVILIDSLNIPSPSPTDPTEPTFTPTPAQANNILVNGDFTNNKDNWSFHTKGQAGFSVINDEARVVVTKTSGVIQLFQSGIELKPDTKYRVTFKGKSTAGSDTTIQIIKHGSPYTNYLVGDGVQLDLTDQWQEVSAEIQTTNFGNIEPNARFRFWLGGQARNGETYSFDDVMLQEI